MTVEELIEKLEKLPPEARACRVVFDDDTTNDDQDYCELTKVGRLQDGRVLLD